MAKSMKEEKLPKLALGLPPLKGGGSGEEPDLDEEGGESDKDADDAAASDDEVQLFTEMKSAIKSGDDASGAASLKAFIKSCMGY